MHTEKELFATILDVSAPWLYLAQMSANPADHFSAHPSPRIAARAAILRHAEPSSHSLIAQITPVISQYRATRCVFGLRATLFNPEPSLSLTICAQKLSLYSFRIPSNSNSKKNASVPSNSFQTSRSPEMSAPSTLP
jgi:hypothetical protein